MTLTPGSGNGVTLTDMRKPGKSTFHGRRGKNSRAVAGLINFLDIHLVILQVQMNMERSVQRDLDRNYIFGNNCVYLLI